MKKVLVIFALLCIAAVAQPKKIGDQAPSFSLKDETGISHTLAEHLGKKSVILIFYPGDNTPVCTKQLCEMRDSYSSLMTSRDVVVYGVNNGTAKSHAAFKAKNGYPFPLLVDENVQVAKLFGVSKGSMVSRHVFVIDPNGKIVFSKKGKPPVADIISAVRKK